MDAIDEWEEWSIENKRRNRKRERMKSFDELYEMREREEEFEERYQIEEDEFEYERFEPEDEVEEDDYDSEDKVLAKLNELMRMANALQPRGRF